jgi:NADPH-dependent curcumin reductase CurA
MISGYNNEPYHIKNLSRIYINSLSIFGIMVYELGPKYIEQFYSEIPRKLKSGEIKYLEDKEMGGLERMGEAIVDVQKGLNFGKKVVIVSEEE